MAGSRPAGAGGSALPGQIMSLSRQIVLRLSDEQKRELTELQKRVDDNLGKILTAGQKARFERLKHDLAASGPGGRVAAAQGRPSGRSPSSAATPGDFAGPLPPGVNSLFSALRYGV